MNFSFERISKYLLLLGLALLLFRNGSFGVTGIPKLFETCIVLVGIFTAIDVLMHRKVSEFLKSIPKQLWATLCILYASIGVGWLIAVYVRHIPSTLNMVYELACFSIAVATFLLILFYSRNDPSYIKKCFYALLVPVVFVFCILVPQFAYLTKLAQGGTFNGFTGNVEIISKMLLIPGLFFTAHALYGQKKWWRRIGSLILTTLLFALVLWTTQRAAMLGYAVGMAALWIIGAVLQRNWKTMIRNALFILLILGVGFLAVPGEGKKAAIDRVLNTDSNQAGYENIKQKTVAEVLEASVAAPTVQKPISETEPRLQIWNYYFWQVIKNPFGLGPNTHMEALIVHLRRTFVNPGPHNAYLEVWLWGGIVGLISFLYILSSAFRNLYRAARENFDVFSLALIGALAALCVAIFFNDNLPSYWLWALLALSFRVWARF